MLCSFGKRYWQGLHYPTRYNELTSQKEQQHSQSTRFDCSYLHASVTSGYATLHPLLLLPIQHGAMLPLDGCYTRHFIDVPGLNYASLHRIRL